MTFYNGVSLSLCFLSLFLSICGRFHLHFSTLSLIFKGTSCKIPGFPLCGSPTRTAQWAPYGALPGSWQDSHRQRMEYHVEYIDYIITMRGSHTWSLIQLLIFPLCNDLLWILNENSWPKWTLSTLTSVCIFSIMFSIHFPRCWEGEFV